MSTPSHSELISVMDTVSKMMHKKLVWDGKRSIEIQNEDTSVRSFLYGTKKELYDKLWAIRKYEELKISGLDKGNKHYWRIGGVIDIGQWHIKLRLVCGTCKKDVEVSLPNGELELLAREYEGLPTFPERCWEDG